MSELTVGSLSGLAANSYVVDIASGSSLDLANAKADSLPTSAISTGGILQVVSTTKTDTFSASLAQGASTPVTGLSATITPRSTSSKILITVSIGQIGTGNGYGDYGVKVFDGSSFIDVGDAAGSRQTVTVGSVGTTNSPASYVNTSISFTIEDAPATTSSRTYSVYVSHGSGSTQTQYVNRSAADSDNTQYHRSSSTITLMEVAG